MFGNWLIVGAGRCGLQLARQMDRAGIPIAAVVVRNPRGRSRVQRVLSGIRTVTLKGPAPPASAVLIAVGDDTLSACAGELAPWLGEETRVAIHTSGLLPAEAIAALRTSDRTIASWHPLMSFPTATGPLVELAGALATTEGDAGATRVARRLGQLLGMRTVTLSSGVKARYHAAAAVAANLTHVLVAAARAELEAVGLTPTAASEALRPLLHTSTEAALAARGLERLSGPLARGDAASIAAHLAAIDPGLADAYRAVSLLGLRRLAAEGLLPAGAQAATGEALTSPDRCDSVRRMKRRGGS
jgi:predicted short-subunit dehydrogenase-like oxidoreductase (DUF2520 family)